MDSKLKEYKIYARQYNDIFKNVYITLFPVEYKSKTPLEPYVENFVFSFLNVVYGIRTIEFEQFKNNKLCVNRLEHV